MSDKLSIKTFEYPHQFLRPHFTPAPETGEGICVIGNYQLNHHLGSGSHGCVFRANVLGEEDQFALKILKVNDGLPVERFRREYDIQNKNQFHCVPTVSHFEMLANTFHCFRMQIFDGVTLDNWNPEVGFSEGELLRAAIELADCLDELHAKNVRHRDLDVKNILIGRKRAEIRLLDLGTAFDGSDPRITPEDQRGYAVGTLRAMDPEVRSNRIPECALNDLYAVGVAMFRLITKRHLHDEAKTHFNRTEVEAFEQHYVYKQSLDGEQFYSDFKDSLLKLVSPNRADRWRSAREFGDDIRRIAEELRLPGIIDRAHRPVLPVEWLNLQQPEVVKLLDDMLGKPANGHAERSLVVAGSALVKAGMLCRKAMETYLETQLKSMRRELNRHWDTSGDRDLNMNARPDVLSREYSAAVSSPLESCLKADLRMLQCATAVQLAVDPFRRTIKIVLAKMPVTDNEVGECVHEAEQILDKFICIIADESRKLSDLLTQRKEWLKAAISILN